MYTSLIAKLKVTTLSVPELITSNEELLPITVEALLKRGTMYLYKKGVKCLD